MEEPKSKRTATTIIILIVTALLIGGAVVLAQQNDKTQDNANKTNVNKTDENSSEKKDTGSTTSSNFKEGSYEATGEYQSPGGSQEIKITISVSSDGTITDTSAEGDDKSSDSRFYQSSFISNYKDKVIGKKINEVKLDHVGASSLTPIGFNDALRDIETQAKA